jgi:hypothetical protein
MASKKAPKKFVEKKDAKTELQMSIQAAVNSNYSLLIPCVDGNFVYVRNPIAGKTDKYPIYRKYVLFAIYARYTNKLLDPIHPNKNNRNRF